MLHLVILLGTAKSRVSSLFCTRLMLATFVSLSAVTCHESWMLVSLLVMGVLLPLWDLHSRGSATRGLWNGDDFCAVADGSVGCATLAASYSPSGC